MKTTELFDRPFCIPYGTRVRLTNNTGKTEVCFFAGYKTYNNNILMDKHDLFPLFKKQNKDGSMSHRNAKMPGFGTISYSGTEYITDIEPIEEKK